MNSVNFIAVVEDTLKYNLKYFPPQQNLSTSTKDLDAAIRSKSGEYIPKFCCRTISEYPIREMAKQKGKNTGYFN